MCIFQLKSRQRHTAPMLVIVGTQQLSKYNGVCQGFPCFVLNLCYILFFPIVLSLWILHCILLNCVAGSVADAAHWFDDAMHSTRRHHRYSAVQAPGSINCSPHVSSSSRLNENEPQPVRVSFIHFVSLNSRILLWSSSRSSVR